MDAQQGAVYDEYTGALTGLAAPQKFVVEDYHLGSDRLLLSAVDPLGNWFDDGEYSPSVFSTLDSNGDSRLTKDDTYVDATADGKGIDLHFWNIELELTNIQSLSQDFLL
jgi:hypothetical protein